MKATTAQRFGSLGKSFVSPSAAAAVLGAALLASDTSDTSETAWSPSAACLLPDVLPVAGTLLSYGGSRQLAAGGTVTHSGALTLGGLLTTNGSANTYGITLPNTVGIAARNVGNTAWNRILNYTAANQCAVGDFDGGGGGLGLYGSGANSWTIASTGHLSASGAFNVTTSGTVRAGAFYEPGGATTGWYMFSNGMYGYVSGGQMLRLNGTGLDVYGTLTANSTVDFQTATNSTTAFRVRNTAGTAIAQVDTTNRTFIAGGDSFAVRTGTGGTYLFNSGFLAVTNSTDASSATADTFLSRASAGVWRTGTTSSNALGALQAAYIGINRTPSSTVPLAIQTNATSSDGLYLYNNSGINVSDFGVTGGGHLRWRFKDGAATNVVTINTDGVSNGLIEAICPAAASKGIVVKGAASQSGNAFEYQSSAGTALFAVTSSGGITASDYIYGTSAQFSALGAFGGYGVGSATLAVQALNSATIGMNIRGQSGQISDLLKCKTSANTDVFTVGPTGAVTASGTVTVSATTQLDLRSSAGVQRATINEYGSSIRFQASSTGYPIHLQGNNHGIRVGDGTYTVDIKPVASNSVIGFYTGQGTTAASGALADIACGAITASGIINNTNCSASEFAAFGRANATASASLGVYQNGTHVIALGYNGTSGAGQVINGIVSAAVLRGDTGLHLVAQGSGSADVASGHITITTNGRVGIGTISPTVALDVNGTVQETPTQSALNPTTTNIPTGKRMGWYNTALAEFRDWVNIGGTLLKSAAYT